MAIDGTMLTAINAIAVAKKHGMLETIESMTQLLDYVATHPNVAITFFPSDMILHIHSDALYLSEPEAMSKERTQLDGWKLMILKIFLKTAQLRMQE